jgi:uncharacterized protein YcfJ
LVGETDGYNSLGTAEGPIGEILGKKDETADGMIDGFTLGTHDGLDVMYDFGSSDGSKVGTIDGAPLGSSVGNTVEPGFRLGKV